MGVLGFIAAFLLLCAMPKSWMLMGEIFLFVALPAAILTGMGISETGASLALSWTVGIVLFMVVGGGLAALSIFTKAGSIAICVIFTLLWIFAVGAMIWSDSSSVPWTIFGGVVTALVVGGLHASAYEDFELER